MPTALAISPHLDDAVFSAGGMLARLAREGWRVVVATVFTASVPDPRGFALACQSDKGLAPDIDYMALRRAEDVAACARIGAETLWLPYAEAPHRGYHSAAALFAGLRDDDAIVDAITPACADLVVTLAADLVLAPQAIGAHVDHVAVHLALRSCKATRWLWADFPYCVRRAPRPSPFDDDLRALTEERIELRHGEIGAKTDAALAYASQIGFQFGGSEQARDAVATSGNVESFLVLPSSGPTRRPRAGAG